MVAGCELSINLSEYVDLIKLHNFEEISILLFHWYDNHLEYVSTFVYNVSDALNPHVEL